MQRRLQNCLTRPDPVFAAACGERFFFGLKVALA
jgi:hypothetical protein